MPDIERFITERPEPPPTPAIDGHPRKEPTINLAIGPNCPVRCEGCYNFFGNTALRGGLVTAEEVIDFAAAAQAEGVTQTTISGGDPLFHPEIGGILSGLSGLGVTVKLDTVGTALLEAPQIVFKGRGKASQVDIADVAPYVSFMSIPLDGASQETLGRFRRGRSSLFEEARAIAALLRNAGVRFGINTVANKANIGELPEMLEVVRELGAAEWQVFEYDPNGPNPSNRKSELKLDPGEFDAATADLSTPGGEGLRVTCKSLANRTGAYFLVDDAGMAWKPTGVEGVRTVLGHITRDRDLVLDALRRHIKEL